MEYIYSEFHSREPLELNNAEIEHLKLLNLNLNGKSTFEVGCGGRGDITNYLVQNGAKVTLNDAREENIKILLKTYNLNLNYNTQDLNHENYNINEKFDIIINYGVMYHLQFPEIAIKNLSNLCNEYMILCSVTNGTDSVDKNIVGESSAVNQAIDNIGSRPGRQFFINELKKNFKIVYTPTILPNYIDFPSSFPSNNGFNRVIFIGSHINLDNNSFLKRV
jgi:2-polyprenyl-3-methyl-5-hydroxy-6-metoxy-1,4-benzoquinol methylase